MIIKNSLLLTAGLLFSLVVGTANAQVAGVAIDAEGVLQLKNISAKASLASVRRAAKNLEGDLGQASDVRYVSLKRLLTTGDSDTRNSMGGLTRIQFVVADPESQDILIAGSAEPYGPDVTGRLVGADSARPLIRFEDLVEAFQYGGETVGCSIDPVPENQQALNDYLRRNSTPASPSAVAARYKQMARILGRQTIRVFGVPRSSHVALAAIEADFLMKQIAIGNRASGVRGVQSQLSHLRPNGNSFQRWWFAPAYDSIATDEERLAFELTGPRLKLLAQDEISDGNGMRFDAAITAETTQAFAKTFSARMDDLARVHCSIATLQNVTDCIMLAAIIRDEQLDRRSEFDIFKAANAIVLPTNEWPEPETVPSAATTKRAGRYILGLVGGVVIDGQRLAREFAPTSNRVNPLQISVPAFANEQFWSNGQ